MANVSQRDQAASQELLMSARSRLVVSQSRMSPSNKPVKNEPVKKNCASFSSLTDVIVELTIYINLLGVPYRNPPSTELRLYVHSDS